MPDAREHPALADDRRAAALVIDRAWREELLRHLAIEPGIPRPKDLAQRAPADALEHAQMAPLLERGAACEASRRWESTGASGERGA
jgi:hypothetical protein